MPEKDPTTYSLITYLWVLGISSMGGIAGYVRRVRTGSSERFSIMEVVGEIFISGFTGLITFWFCESADIDPLLTAALVGVSDYVSDSPINTLSGDTGNARSRYTVNAWASTYEEVQTLKDVIVSAMSSNVRLSTVPLHEPKINIYRIAVDYSLFS